jgi:hypothetical protein
MRKAGVAVLVGSVVAAGLLLLAWLLGLVTGLTGGGLIHLLLVLALLIGPAGVIVGVVLLVVAGARAREP